MSKKTKMSDDNRLVVAWFESQPGVTSVASTRFTRTRHSLDPGTIKVMNASAKSVSVRVYDALGSRDLFVHAPQSALRDAWIGKILNGRLPESPVRTMPMPAFEVPVSVPVSRQSEAVKQDAAQLFDVTPELAAIWLEHNTRSRKLRQAVVNRYAADMIVPVTGGGDEGLGLNEARQGIKKEATTT